MTARIVHHGIGREDWHHSVWRLILDAIVLVAVWLITNAKNGISSYELARAIGVTQKSAWFMLHRIRLSMQDEMGGKKGGKARAEKLTPEERSLIAKRAAEARWGKER